MAVKNYLTIEEQIVWEYIQDKEIVDNELVEQIFPEMKPNKRNKILHSLYGKGYLQRAIRGLYYNPENLKSFHQLALRIRVGYLGLSSALRYHNLIDYEDFTIFVMTPNYQKKIDLSGTQYTVQFIPLKSLFTGFEKRDGLYVSTVEKTLFDCFLKPRFIGYTNITKALYDAKIGWHKFIGFYNLTKNSSLCQRTGYILELMEKNTKLKVPRFVFEFLLKKVKNPARLMQLGGKSAFNRKWKIQDSIGEKNILSWWG